MHGFFSFSRGTPILDLIAVGLFLVVPILLWSISLVKFKKEYENHRKIQTTLFILLAILVLAFEIELRLVNWREGTKLSPYYGSFLNRTLAIHLVFAISTAFLWALTFWTAHKYIPRPAQPSKFSHKHRILGWATVIDTLLTAVTGWFFYYIAFIAR